MAIVCEKRGSAKKKMKKIGLKDIAIVSEGERYKKAVPYGTIELVVYDKEVNVTQVFCSDSDPMLTLDGDCVDEILEQMSEAGNNRGIIIEPL